MDYISNRTDAKIHYIHRYMCVNLLMDGMLDTDICYYDMQNNPICKLWWLQLDKH